MTKQELEMKARAHMTMIEERYSDFVPSEIQSYWLLNFLIAEGLRNYTGSYGLRPLHLGDCSDGRQMLGEGPLNGWERDCVKFLNDYCEREEKIYENRKRIGIATYSQVE